MKKRNFKILIACFVIILVFSTTVVGVFAVLQNSLDISSTVSFASSSGVNVLVKGKLECDGFMANTTGFYSGSNQLEVEEDGFSTLYQKNSGASESSESVNMKFEFDENAGIICQGNVFSITYSIQNISRVYDFYLDFKEPSLRADVAPYFCNYFVSFDAGFCNPEHNKNGYKILANTTAICTITFSMKSDITSSIELSLFNPISMNFYSDWRYLDDLTYTISSTAFSSGALKGYYYITFPNSDIKWVIIGGGAETYKPSNAPDGAFGENQIDGLTSRQVLLISENILCKSKFYVNNKPNQYSNTSEESQGCYAPTSNNGTDGVGLLATYSAIKTKNNPNGTLDYGLAYANIVPRNIVTYWNDGNNEYMDNSLTNQYIFPLSDSVVSTEQEFLVQSYLETNAKRVAKFNNTTTNWWLRTASTLNVYDVSYCKTDGTIHGAQANTLNGVRPSFVMSLD